MATPADRRPGRDIYPLKFGGAALVLVSAALFLVLFVLPRRYVLSSGFQESGVSFPVTSQRIPAGALVQRQAGPIPQLPAPVPAKVPRGPAEVFWDTVLPLLEAGEHDRAVEVIETYLARFPDDRAARVELANTLLRAERRAEAVEVMGDLLREEEDPAIRLVLARTLRDLDRMAAASAQYAFLAEQGVQDTDLSLEWARSLSWVELYDEAESVLQDGLRSDPDAVALQVELARVYYYTDRLEAAEAILAGLDGETLDRWEAVELQEGIRVALTPPPDPETPEPTIVEQATAAREAGELDRAAELLRAALEADPGDEEVRRAYGDLLQYQLMDLEAARQVLVPLADRNPGDAALQWRLALLENWTGRMDDAQARLEALAGVLQPGDALPDPADPDGPPITRARVQVLRGDLLRWSGERTRAAEVYEDVLAASPANPDAQAGMELLRAGLYQDMAREERPGAQALVYALEDTDDFLRIDLGSRVAAIRGRWALTAQGGRRQVDGIDPTGAAGSQAGLFAGVEAARWWGWGRVRTSARFGVETVRRGEQEYSWGASARIRGVLGFATLTGSYDRSPAYGSTVTLQSLLTDVVQDVLKVELSGNITPVWRLWAQGQWGWLDTQGLSAVPVNGRLQGGFALLRDIRPWLAVGASGQLLSLRDPAPLFAGRPLYWDPSLAVGASPLVQLQQPLGSDWMLSSRLAPGFAYLEERRTPGGRTVPNLAGELGLRWDGEKVWAGLDLFYGQGQFDGYASWGARLTLGTSGVPGLGGSDD